jgi:hypothetical protein
MGFPNDHLNTQMITRMEEKLCDEMGLSISELNIEGIRRMWNTRQTFEQLHLDMV